jgi:hypothetical protein
MAIDRATGRVRWEARPGLIDALALVGEQVIVAALVKGDMSAMRLTTLGAADGRTIGSHELTLAVRPTDRRRGGQAARVVVASDAVRFAVAGRDVLAVVEVPAG